MGGRLYLTGISSGAYEQVVRTGKLRLSGPLRAYEATPIVGQSTREVYADAGAWLVGLDANSDAAGDVASGGTGSEEVGGSREQRGAFGEGPPHAQPPDSAPIEGSAP